MEEDEERPGPAVDAPGQGGEGPRNAGCDLWLVHRGLDTPDLQEPKTLLVELSQHRDYRKVLRVLSNSLLLALGGRQRPRLVVFCNPDYNRRRETEVALRRCHI